MPRLFRLSEPDCLSLEEVTSHQIQDGSELYVVCMQLGIPQGLKDGNILTGNDVPLPTENQTLIDLPIQQLPTDSRKARAHFHDSMVSGAGILIQCQIS